MPLRYKYESQFSWISHTPVSIQEINNEFGSEAAFIQWLKDSMQPFVSMKITEAFLEQGKPCVVTHWSWNYVYLHPLGDLRTPEIKVNCTLESDENWSESPIAPLVIVAIGVAIALIVAAIVVPIAFFNTLSDMGTRSYRIEQWEWVQNPDTGEWEWKLVKTEEGTEPDIGGIGAIGAIFLIFVAMILLFFFMKDKK